jgi:surface rod structure-forming protein G/transglycosylase-like protein with SLT domain/uncharacterized protein DUF348
VLSRLAVLPRVLRLGRLALVSYLVAMGTWMALQPGQAATAADSRRASPLARGAVAGRPAEVTVSVDGLATTFVAAGTVEEALRQLGLVAGTGDRLSAGPWTELVPGGRIAVDRGVPVTLLVGGSAFAGRSAGGTVGDLLAAHQVILGPLDTVDHSVAAPLRAGDIVRVTRIADHEEIVRQTVPYGVRYVTDPELGLGRQVLVTPGQSGEVANTYLVRMVDGVEVARTLVTSVQLVVPVEEVRRQGLRLPLAPAEIEAVIRAAAARYGADPEQLLRVAWCESKYNPNAYNVSSGASGLFQFMPRTWAANSVRVGYDGASPFDPVAAANVAAWMFANGSASLWTCK